MMPPMFALGYCPGSEQDDARSDKPDGRKSQNMQQDRDSELPAAAR